MFHRMAIYSNGDSDSKPTAVLTKEIIMKTLPRLKRYEDLIIIEEQAWKDFKNTLPLPVTINENSPFSIDQDELASLVCQSVQKPVCRRLAIEKHISSDNYQTYSLEMILGDSGLVWHEDNNILYQFDLTKCMFPFGSLSEKMRMASLDCSAEVVVDLFAGVGHFSLPVLMHAKAKHLYACEKNPSAIQALRDNLKLNKIAPNRYTVIEGDNRLYRPFNVAQRVILNISPSCVEFMKTALDCVDKATGAVIHCHDLVDTRSQEKDDPTSCPDRRDMPLCSSTSPTNSASSQIGGSAIPVYSTFSSEGLSLMDQSFNSSSISSHSTSEMPPVRQLEDLSLQSRGEDTKLPIISNSTTSPTSATDQKSAEINSDDRGNDTEKINAKSAPSSEFVSPNDASLSPEGMLKCLNFDESKSIEDDDPIKDEFAASLCEKNFMEACKAKAVTLMAHIREELEIHNLIAMLVKIQPVRSYAPHVKHVVFDIKIKPKHVNCS